MIGSLVSSELRARVRGLALPIALAFGRVGFTPNALTVVGFGIAESGRPKGTVFTDKPVLL